MIVMLSTRRIRPADEIATNEDLLVQILVRLPIKPLLNFKFVYKQWFSLISSPHFSRLRNPYPNPISGLFLHISSSIYDLQYNFVRLNGRPSISPPFRPLSFVDDPSRIIILQSCNGFLLCCFRNSGEDSKRKKYFIYNPTTQQVILLPELLNQVFNPVVGVGIAFDPSKSLHYKVVCIKSIDSVRPYRFGIEIYSSGFGSWRQSGDHFTALGDQFNCGVLWNGAIHWINNLGPRDLGPRVIHNLGIIVSFDANEERLKEIPMPEIPNDWNQSRIGESWNHLHLILLKNPSIAQVNVYELERDYSNNSRWFVIHQIDLNAVLKTAVPLMRRSIRHHSHFLLYAFLYSVLSVKKMMRSHFWC